MKQLLWSAIAVLFLAFSAHAADTKLAGKWRAEEGLPNKDPSIAWVLELEKGGTFRMTELALNVPEKFRKEMEKVETGRWWIIEPSLTEKLKTIIWKTETGVGLEFAPTQDEVKRGQARKYFGRVVEKNERYNGKTTLHLTATSVLEGCVRNCAISSYRFVRVE